MERITLWFIAAIPRNTNRLLLGEESYAIEESYGRPA